MTHWTTCCRTHWCTPTHRVNTAFVQRWTFVQLSSSLFRWTKQINWTTLAAEWNARVQWATCAPIMFFNLKTTTRFVWDKWVHLSRSKKPPRLTYTRLNLSNHRYIKRCGWAISTSTAAEMATNATYVSIHTYVANISPRESCLARPLYLSAEMDEQCSLAYCNKASRRPWMLHRYRAGIVCYI